MSSLMFHVPLNGPILEPDSKQWSTTTPTMAQHQQNHSSSSSAAEMKEGTFPVKLHNMLQKVEGTIYEELTRWDPDGMSFVIYKPKEFADQLMGSFFKQTKYKSFQRQLNFYGFVRSRRGIIRGVYTHPLFQREKPLLCNRMRRMDSSGNELYSSSESIRQQTSALSAMPNRISLTSSSPPPSSPINSLPFMDELSPKPLMNMPNNNDLLMSQIRRRTHNDDGSMGTIDELPFGSAPCILSEDDPF